MQTEAEFNKALREALELFLYHRTILWFERLNSGKVNTVHGGWMQLCKPGTPDWIVIFQDRQCNLSVLFIEGKSDSGIKIHKKSQDDFAENNKHFKVLRTADIKEVKDYINDNSVDRMKKWGEEVDLFMQNNEKETF